MSFPGFIRDVNVGENVAVQPGITYRVNPDEETARLAAARKDAEAAGVAATASCQPGCTMSGHADGALYIAQLAGQAAQHAAATGHVVTVQIAPKAAGPGDG